MYEPRLQEASVGMGHARVVLAAARRAMMDQA